MLVIIINTCRLLLLVVLVLVLLVLYAVSYYYLRVFLYPAYILAALHLE